MNALKIKILSPDGIAPIRGSKFAAGYDIFSAEDVLIEGRLSALVKTDIAVKVPEGTYGRLCSRSGLALNFGIDIAAGVIDADFRGSVGVLMRNGSDIPFVVRKGMRIAQLILEKIETPAVEVVDKLDATERGEKGFGSSGK